KSAQSYLNVHQILSAADITGADAIHSGYVFLSEDDEFSEMSAKWCITFIGPSPECVLKMDGKIESKILARETGIPLLEPSHVECKSLDEIKAEAKKMGYPILIKASAGGGGRGMKRIESEKELPDTLARLEVEAKNAFGDGTLFIEKYI